MSVSTGKSASLKFDAKKSSLLARAEKIRSEKNASHDFGEIEMQSKPRASLLLRASAIAKKNSSECKEKKSRANKPVIMQGDDGIFSISNDFIIPAIDEDDSFKNLVDSVLYN
ncbi:MAG: hypothetical protein K2N58_01245 [Treponemataceae bacterium]|nr:hypothetical protein [Treponemataceae bacterium]